LGVSAGDLEPQRFQQFANDGWRKDSFVCASIDVKGFESTMLDLDWVVQLLNGSLTRALVGLVFDVLAFPLIPGRLC